MSTPRALRESVNALKSARTAAQQRMRKELHAPDRIHLDRLRWWGSVGGQIDAMLALLALVGEGDAALVARDVHHDVRELVELVHKGLA